MYNCEICSNVGRNQTLIGGYSITICNECLNKWQKYLRTSYAETHLEFFYYIRKVASPSLTMPEAKRFLVVEDIFFKIAEDWVKEQIGENE